MAKSVALILLSIIIAVSGQVMLKAGVEGIGRIGAREISRPLNVLGSILASPLILVGFFLYAISAILWIVVLSRVPLSYAYPFLGLTYVFMLFITKYLFNEPIPSIRWVGTAVICLGVVLSGLS